MWYGGTPGRPLFPSHNYGRDYETSRPERVQSRRRLPPDYRRYLSREEYGLGPEWERGREGGREGPDHSGRRGSGPERFNEGVLGPRNALFGREGFRRYREDYEQWW